MNSSLRITQRSAIARNLLAVAGAILSTLVCHAMPDRVTIAWDPNPEPDIAGYRVHFGIVGSSVTNILGSTQTTQQAVTSLLPETQYWFYVTAFNTAGLESDPSDLLTYTTPANLPPTITLGPDRMAIVPASISLTADATDDWLSPENLNYAWRQTSGTNVVLNGAATDSATIILASPGTYQFAVDVNDGVNSVSDGVVVTAVPWIQNPPPGAVVPDIHTMLQTFDGLVLGWNSAPNVSYVVAFKSTLDETTWRILANDVPSMGSVTYWVDEFGGLGQQGFYGIFQKP